MVQYKNMVKYLDTLISAITIDIPSANKDSIKWCCLPRLRYVAFQSFINKFIELYFWQRIIKIKKNLLYLWLGNLNLEIWDKQEMLISILPNK